MRKPLLLSLAILATACAQRGGYTREMLLRNCLAEFPGETWDLMDSPPPDALALRTIALGNFPGIDPENPRPRETWFRRDDTGYVICYLAGRNGCGQTTTSVVKTASGWELGPGSITVC